MFDSDLINENEDAYDVWVQDQHMKRLQREADERGLTLNQYIDDLCEEAGMIYNEDTEAWEWFGDKHE